MYIYTDVFIKGNKEAVMGFFDMKVLKQLKQEIQFFKHTENINKTERGRKEQKGPETNQSEIRKVGSPGPMVTPKQELTSVTRCTGLPNMLNRAAPLTKMVGPPHIPKSPTNAAGLPLTIKLMPDAVAIIPGMTYGGKGQCGQFVHCIASPANAIGLDINKPTLAY